MPNAILTDAMELGLGASEPWPQPLNLYQPYQVEQILFPDNAICAAVETFLRFCNLNFEIKPCQNAEFMSPSGKVPFIQCGAFLIADFDNIVSFVNNKGTSLTSNLSAEEKADMRAYISLINNGLSNAEQYICWLHPPTAEVTKKRHGSIYPWPLNHILNWQKQRQVMKKLKVLGLYSKSIDEIYEDVKMCCKALSERLGNKMYFYQDNGPTELDALVFGHLYTILTTELPSNKLGGIVNQFPELVNFCRRIDTRYYGRGD